MTQFVLLSAFYNRIDLQALTKANRTGPLSAFSDFCGCGVSGRISGK
jgi:hypothetical protein